VPTKRADFVLLARHRRCGAAVTVGRDEHSLKLFHVGSRPTVQRKCRDHGWHCCQLGFCRCLIDIGVFVEALGDSLG
jgi:hypothetical protein